MEVTFKGREIYDCFFEAAEANKHKCKACDKKLNQDLSKGYANLRDHVERTHKDWKHTVKAFLIDTAEGPMDKFVVQPSTKARNLYGWLTWIIEENLPISFVEMKTTRCYTSLESISIKTLKKYMSLMKSLVERRMKAIVPKTFGLIIDGWTMGSVHYFGIFITWTDNKDTVREYLVYFGNGGDIDEDTVYEDGIDERDKFLGFSAADWFDVICEALNDFLFGRELVINIDTFKEYVEFITMDNCAVNRKLARDSEVPMVGCASHRLHLAILEMLGKEEKRNRVGVVTEEGTDHMVLIQKVDSLMGELVTLKNAVLLRTQTPLLPERRNRTRWYSIFNMLLKWLRIRNAVAAVQHFPVAVLNLIPTANENAAIQHLVEILKKFESVSKVLQRGGDRRVSVFIVRALFDKLISDFPSTPLTHIQKNADIIENKAFENGICKIQGGIEQSLTREEKAAVAIFLRNDATNDDDDDVAAASETEGYGEDILRSAEKSKRARVLTSKYRSTAHVASNSNIVERANSRAKLILSTQRRRMKSETVQMTLFLHQNKSLWPDARSVQAILDEPLDLDEDPDAFEYDEDENDL